MDRVDPVNFSEGLQSRMLEALRGVVSANNRTIDFLDLGLSKLVKAGRVEEVREFVAGLVSRGDDPIRLRKLDSLVRALIEDPNGALGEWVVAWLRDGDHRLCSAMDRALFDAGRDERALSIDFSRFCLSDAEYPYIARKVFPRKGQQQSARTHCPHRSEQQAYADGQFRRTWSP